MSGEQYSGQNNLDGRKPLVKGKTEWLTRNDARNDAIFERRSQFLNVIVLSFFGRGHVTPTPFSS